MPSPYDKNFTEDGYLMKYKQDQSTGSWKNIVLQFKIELKNLEPLIWRRILVPSIYNFWDLHVAIQDSLGWQDYHLHHFEIRGKGKHKPESIGIPDFDGASEGFNEAYPGWEISVVSRFNDLGVKAEYIYDYGDDWRHSVLLEGYLLKEKNEKYPQCIGGERACPPEDCGGIGGYFRLLQILSNPKNMGGRKLGP